MNEAAPASDPAFMTAEEALAAAEAEGLTLLLADNATGFACVARLTPKGRAKPYKADVWEEGKIRNLGTFATGEGAALAVARSLGPEGVAAKLGQAAAGPAPMTAEEAIAAAEAEGLVLLRAEVASGFKGVSLLKSRTKPYKRRGLEAARQAGGGRGTSENNQTQSTNQNESTRK